MAPSRPIRQRKRRWSWELGTVFSRGQSDDRHQVARLRNVRVEGGFLRMLLDDRKPQRRLLLGEPILLAVNYTAAR